MIASFYYYYTCTILVLYTSILLNELLFTRLVVHAGLSHTYSTVFRMYLMYSQMPGNTRELFPCIPGIPGIPNVFHQKLKTYTYRPVNCGNTSQKNPVLFSIVSAKYPYLYTWFICSQKVPSLSKSIKLGIFGVFFSPGFSLLDVSMKMCSKLFLNSNSSGLTSL